MGESIFDGIASRVAQDRDEGDVSYFHALALRMEFDVKLATVGLIACIEDDADRNRYGLEHTLVRANSLGNWTSALHSSLLGPPAQFFGPRVRSIVQEFTEITTEGHWQNEFVSNMARAATILDIPHSIGDKVALRHGFDLCVQIRNRTRGHGATTSERCHKLCPPISNALDQLEQRLKLFRLPWVYIRRNLNGKYRVIPLLGDSSDFDYLKYNAEASLKDGVYLHIGQHKPVQLAFLPDESTMEVSLPNGNFRSSGFEVLSYSSDSIDTVDGSDWLTPPQNLPPSETEGQPELEILGNLFSNLPPMPSGHVPRTAIEARLANELLVTDRHPIVSLTGSGGIGKTTIAIAAINTISERVEPPFEVAVWISARDIDLLDEGPKPVASHVVTKSEIANAVVDLVGKSHDDSRSAEGTVQDWFLSGTSGPTLFVFDNFETVYDPADVFKWIDTYIRPPNKVLITTRVRDFVGDYPIEITGMNEQEARTLIDNQANRLGISELLNTKYKTTLIDEAEGHPYVIKILLGQVAKEGQAIKPARIIGSSDQLLTALFERTFAKLQPASQRVFLLLCMWRVFVPRVAVEAVSLRPGSEKFDVQGALNELRRYSLVEHVPSGKEESEEFVGVPLAAAMFGKRKLETSPFKKEIQEDLNLLQEFGPGRRQDVRAGIMPRVERVIKEVSLRAKSRSAALIDMLPILEYIASRVPTVYLHLANLIREIDRKPESLDRANGYLERYLEFSPPNEKSTIWLDRASIFEKQGNLEEELRAIAEAGVATNDIEHQGNIANRINGKFNSIGDRKSDVLDVYAVRETISNLAEIMYRRVNQLSATNCSRLSWLMLNLGAPDRAKDVARKGIEIDPLNEYCRNLIETLN